MIATHKCINDKGYQAKEKHCHAKHHHDCDQITGQNYTREQKHRTGAGKSGYLPMPAAAVKQKKSHGYWEDCIYQTFRTPVLKL
jgi:hypothetical protein